MESDREYGAKKRRKEREACEKRNITVYPINFRGIDLQKLRRIAKKNNKTLSKMVSKMIQEYSE